MLCTFFADCVPLFFVDPVKKAIGLSHSGWRGTVQKIGKKTVEKMQEAFGSDPKSIIDFMNHNVSLSFVRTPTDKIRNLMEQHNRALMEEK